LAKQIYSILNINGPSVRVEIPKRALMTYPFVSKTKTKPVALTCVTSVWVVLNFSFAFEVYIRLSESWKLFTWDKISSKAFHKER